MTGQVRQVKIRGRLSRLKLRRLVEHGLDRLSILHEGVDSLEIRPFLVGDYEAFIGSIKPADQFSREKPVAYSAL